MTILSRDWSTPAKVTVFWTWAAALDVTLCFWYPLEPE
jgi:hypothetical protein